MERSGQWCLLKEHYLKDLLKSSPAEEVMQGMQRSRNQNGEEGDVRVSECHSCKFGNFILNTRKSSDFLFSVRNHLHFWAKYYSNFASGKIMLVAMWRPFKLRDWVQTGSLVRRLLWESTMRNNKGLILFTLIPRIHASFFGIKILIFHREQPSGTWPGPWSTTKGMPRSKVGQIT